MKTIGLIGGMSWESSLEYYRIINETVKENLGGLHLPRKSLKGSGEPMMTNFRVTNENRLVTNPHSSGMQK
jgi:aspartate/glutamate racemase